MITFFLIVMGAFLLVGVVILVMNSGTRGGRHGQASRAVLNKHLQTRGDRRGGGLD
jgi:hypothetical protein